MRTGLQEDRHGACAVKPENASRSPMASERPASPARTASAAAPTAVSATSSDVPSSPSTVSGAVTQTPPDRRVSNATMSTAAAIEADGSAALRVAVVAATGGLTIRYRKIRVRPMLIPPRTRSRRCGVRERRRAADCATGMTLSAADERR